MIKKIRDNFRVYLEHAHPAFLTTIVVFNKDTIPILLAFRKPDLIKWRGLLKLQNILQINVVPLLQGSLIVTLSAYESK